jgi:hypothetical protein
MSNLFPTIPRLPRSWVCAQSSDLLRMLPHDIQKHDSNMRQVVCHPVKLETIPPFQICHVLMLFVRTQRLHPRKLRAPVSALKLPFVAIRLFATLFRLLVVSTRSLRTSQKANIPAGGLSPLL